MQFLKATLTASTCLHTLALAALYDCQELSADTVCLDSLLPSHLFGREASHLAQPGSASMMPFDAKHDCFSANGGLECMQITFVKGHFVEVMCGEGKAGLGELPEDVLRDLLQSEELETQSEMQVLEVRPALRPPACRDLGHQFTALVCRFILLCWFFCESALLTGLMALFLGVR